MDILDTNIFILAIYSPLYRKGVCKFIKESKDYLPFSLYNEIYRQSLTLLVLMQKIDSEIKKGKTADKISEITNLQQKYDNIYTYFKGCSNDFKNKESLLKVIDSGINTLLSIDAWINSVKFYPHDEQTEKNILNRYNSVLGGLKCFEELHNADLKILVILHDICTKEKTQARFVTRDKNSILVRKKEIEKELPTLNLITIAEYLK